MANPSLVLFGSFLQFSTLVAQALHQSSAVDLIAVVSTPPQPSGRRQQPQPTHTHQWAKTNRIPVFTPSKLNPNSLQEFEALLIKSQLSHPPDFILSAGYSKLIPRSWLNWPKVAPLNFHPSLLPKYPGTRPGEFALLFGDEETGVTLQVMDEHFDTGPILLQPKLPVASDDTRLSLYQKLYQTEADTITHALTHFNQLTPQFQTHPLLPPYARTLNRQDGFLPYDSLQSAISGQEPPTPMPLLSEFHLTTSAASIYRTHRALYQYPGLWTEVKTPKGTKRLKLLDMHFKNHRIVLEKVQLEGLKPSTFSQITNQLV